MDSVKCIKKSTVQQLQTLVEFMEQNPEFARGTPVFGASKVSTEEKWQAVCQKLNSCGPPTRSIADWKKTWADLKSRTKKKIAENRKNLQETGGGLYRFNYLTELEQIIDRTLMLSSAAAPSGKTYGGWVENVTPHSIDDCFQSLVKTPPRDVRTIAVITPTTSTALVKSVEIVQHLEMNDLQLPQSLQQNKKQSKGAAKRQSHASDDDEQTTFSSAKKKRNVDEKLTLIRRQLRVAERNAAAATEQADAMKKLASAAELQAESAKRTADSADIQAACMKLLVEATERMEKNMEKFLLTTKK